MLLFRSSQTRLPYEIFDIGALLTRPRAENEAIIRGLCNVAYLGDCTALCRVLGRYKMFADTHDVGLSSHLMLDGYWEMWVTEAIASRIRPGMVAADIGANLGYFSLLMAELVGPGGFLHAFEPNLRMVERLQKSLDVNGFGGRSSVHQVALGATDGEPMVFVVPPNEPKNAHMVPLNGDVPNGASLLHTQTLSGNPDWSEIEFAKIDVEGAEEVIWSGAHALLEARKLRTVVLEFTPARYQDAAQFLDRILAPGFSLSYIDPHRGITAISRDELFARNPFEDIMLMLER